MHVRKVESFQHVRPEEKRGSDGFYTPDGKKMCVQLAKRVEEGFQKAKTPSSQMGGLVLEIDFDGPGLFVSVEEELGAPRETGDRNRGVCMQIEGAYGTELK